MEECKISNYFRYKSASKDFHNRFDSLLKICGEKRIIIFGTESEFEFLSEQYSFEKMNIIAFADKSSLSKIINNNDFDFILIISETAKTICEDLKKIKIENEKIKVLFEDEFEDERVSFLHLEKINFGEYLDTIEKTLKNKRVLIYGAGVLLKTAMKYYDLSKLNIIGISDKIYTVHEKDEKFYQYTVFSPEEMLKTNPDYILVSTKFYINIIYDIYTKKLKNTKIKIKPLFKKSLFTLLKEI